MMTPKLPFLALTAALCAPAAAGDVQHRCDVSWLEDAAKVPTDSLPQDATGKYLKDEAVTGGSRKVLNDSPDAKLCDAAVWRYVHSGDDDLKARWAQGWPEQVKVLTEVDARFQKVETAVLAALAAGDAAADAAVKAGVAERKDGPKPDALVAAGWSTHGELVSYVLTKASAAPKAADAELKKAFDVLIAEKAGPAGGSKTVVPGSGVTAFRKAVVAAADAAATPKSSWKPGAAGAAVDEARYKAALAFLAGAAALEPADAQPRLDAELTRYDYALRNLLSGRAAAVSLAYEAARARVPAATPPAAKKPSGPADLPADVLAHLGKVKDYQDLNALFEAKSKAAATDPKAAEWLKGEEGTAVRQRLDAMRADAAAVKVAGPGTLQYSVGGTVMTTTVRVPALQNGQYRDYIADAVALAIASNPLDGKLMAALAAFRNQSPAAPPPPDAPVDKLPPPPAAPPKEGSTTGSALETITRATPAPSLWNWWTGRMESYLSKQNEQAAADALAASQKRQEAQRRADAARAMETAKCDGEKAEIRSRPADPVWKKDAADRWRAGLLAAKETECQGRIQGAFDKVVADAKLAPEGEVSAAKKKREDDALNLVKQAYAEGIGASIEALRTEYQNPKTSRAKDAASESGLGQFYGNHLDLVKGYFVGNWDGDKRAPSTAACQGILWHPSSRGPNKTVNSASFKDPTLDNVDGLCVHAGLVTHLKGYINTGDVAK